jgi:hypothetical protein
VEEASCGDASHWTRTWRRPVGAFTRNSGDSNEELFLDWRRASFGYPICVDLGPKLSPKYGTPNFRSSQNF